MNEEKKEEWRKMRQESDSHITVTRNGKKLIDNGRLTVFGNRELEVKTKEE